MSFVHFLLGLCCGLVLGTAVAVLHAQDLDGAVYAQWYEGELPTMREPEQADVVLVQPPSTAPVFTVWDKLAACESNGNWSVVSRSGIYRGGLQFDQQTWHAYGGGAYASSAHLASKAAQIAVAERLRAARGFQPWPVCSRIVGLR